MESGLAAGALGRTPAEGVLSNAFQSDTAIVFIITSKTHDCSGAVPNIISGMDQPDLPPDITGLLNAAHGGDANAANALIEAVYKELRHMASAKMAGESPGRTINGTELVHEAWLRLGNGFFENRAHFFGAAAEAMRRVLVDRARRRQCGKRGGGVTPVAVDDIELAAPEDNDELLAVHDALDRLAACDPRKADLVKLRYFVGLSFDECACLLGVSVPTAKRDWSYARAWLHHVIHDR